MADQNDTAQPPAILERVDLLLLALLLLLTFLIGSFAATNSEVWLHMASGRHIAQGDWTIGADPFSFATEATGDRPAVPWVQQSWLYALLFYLFYNLVGGAGLVVLKALAVVALAWCLLQIPGGKKGRLMSVIYVGLAVLAMSPQLILRPMTVSLLFFGITLLICYRAGALGSVAPNPRLLWRLPLLFLLWANLDAWFIMGPLTLVLLWAGMGFGALLRIPGTFPGKTMTAVLGVGLLACMVNPHHVQVFMLPPELAYIVVRVVDVPDFLGAGGRALRNAQLVDPDYYSLISPLSWNFWNNVFGGGSQLFPGVAYVLLLLLGLISFVVNAAVTKKPGAPGLHPGRFILWAFLAFLSLLQIRLIPWFAIASAPLTLLNLVDWRNWLGGCFQTGTVELKGPVPVLNPVLQQPATSVQVRNWRPALLGRALALLGCLILLALAWPGWLNAPLDDFASTRRVTWQMPVDPSYHGAALQLAALNEQGRGLRVFNFSPDMAHYCAWFAPGVKCFVDSRITLFPDKTAAFVRARKALSARDPETWQKTFLDHKVDYLVLSNFQGERDAELARRFWLDEAHWLQKYGDGRTLIFAWSGPNNKFGDEFRVELARRAFGQVPEDQRAPAQGPVLPDEEPSLWSQYWNGVAPLPLAAYECNLWLRYHQTMATAWQGPFVLGSQVARWAEPAGLGFLSITLPFALETMDAIPTRVYFNRYRSNNKLILKARDFSSAAAPVLMIRCARRAVAENPNHAGVYLFLADACKLLMNDQEDHWANYRGDRRLMGGMRSKIRQLQIITAFKAYLELRPEDPEINRQVGEMYLQSNFPDVAFLDIALEHLQQAATHLRASRAIAMNPQALELFKKKKTELEKGVQGLEEEVKKRRESYALEAATKQGLAKYPLAMQRGLAKEALEALQVKMEGLQPQEKEARDMAVTQLLLQLGRARYLTDALAKAGPGFAEFRVYQAAALGNYTSLDQALGEIEKTLTRRKTSILTSKEVIADALDQGLFVRTFAGHFSLTRLQRTVDDLARAEADRLAFRGIMALEYGDTAAARKHLGAALQVAGPGNNFQDRAIAERYIELLNDE